jgi:hypothetical protein
MSGYTARFAIDFCITISVVCIILCSIFTGVGIAKHNSKLYTSSIVLLSISAFVLGGLVILCVCDPFHLYDDKDDGFDDDDSDSDSGTGYRTTTAAAARVPVTVISAAEKARLDNEGAVSRS